MHSIGSLFVYGMHTARGIDFNLFSSERSYTVCVTLHTQYKI